MDSERLDILIHPEATISLEYSDEFAIVHIKESEKFTKDTIKWMGEQLINLHKFITTAGYAGLFAGIPKENTMINKLATNLGFSPIGDHDGIQVYFYSGKG